MLAHLKEQYGHTSFRYPQKSIIKNLLKKRDVIAILPTGKGKSLLYQFVGTYVKKMVIIVSPLISLMNDQQMHLNAQGIKSICLNSESISFTNAPNSIKNLINQLKNVIICYTTPEFLSKHIEIFKEENICLFGIDEAHCISSYGHDFRPSFRNLSVIKKQFPTVPILCVTASSTPLVTDDMFVILNLNETILYNTGTRRENLSISVKVKSNCILKDLKIDINVSTIIYVNTRKEAESINELLNSNKIPCVCYHGGMSANDKNNSHVQFSTDCVHTIVCTQSFGMGINKPDIKNVINYGAPSCLENYYQQIGRAGRDGKESFVTLFYDELDFKTNMYLFSKSTEKEHKQSLLNTFRKFINNTYTCRQLMIDEYFEQGHLNDEIPLDKEKCMKCDNCLCKSNTLIDVTIEVNLVYNVILSLSYSYGIIKIIKILTGKKHSSLQHLYTNPFYGKGKNIGDIKWKEIVEFMISSNYICRTTIDNYIVLKVGNKEPDNKDIFLNSKQPILVENTSPGMKKLLEIRSLISSELNIAPYMICSNEVLELILKHKPKDIVELFEMDGISVPFVEKYGDRFIDVLNTLLCDNISTPSIFLKDKKPKSTTNTAQITYDLWDQGKTVFEIARTRDMKQITIEGHISKILSEHPSKINKERFGITRNMLFEIEHAVKSVGKTKLKPIKELVNQNITYLQIRICLLLDV